MANTSVIATKKDLFFGQLFRNNFDDDSKKYEKKHLREYFLKLKKIADLLTKIHLLVQSDSLDYLKSNAIMMLNFRRYSLLYSRKSAHHSLTAFVLLNVLAEKEHSETVRISVCVNVLQSSA